MKLLREDERERWLSISPALLGLLVAMLGSLLPQLDLGQPRIRPVDGFFVIYGIAALGNAARSRKPWAARTFLLAVGLGFPAIQHTSTEIPLVYGGLLPQLAIGVLGFFLVRALDRRTAGPPYGKAVLARSTPEDATP